tara:strand:+ start:75 stop:428 length:354 start_codon:yes stop_codon:yes gene_type:complete
MADEVWDYGVETRTHIWRRYNTAPFARFAISVERSKAAEGYTIVDHDERVADAAFLAKFAGFMRAPLEYCRTGYVDTAAKVAVTEIVPIEQPGTLLHFESAVRRFPDCAIKPHGRSS